eukprot:7249449-Alexandrium_andersonii.AAC.1
MRRGLGRSSERNREVQIQEGLVRAPGLRGHPGRCSERFGAIQGDPARYRGQRDLARYRKIEGD